MYPQFLKICTNTDSCFLCRMKMMLNLKNSKRKVLQSSINYNFTALQSMWNNCDRLMHYNLKYESHICGNFKLEQFRKLRKNLQSL